jgi:hypothetical protein
VVLILGPVVLTPVLRLPDAMGMLSACTYAGCMSNLALLRDLGLDALVADVDKALGERLVVLDELPMHLKRVH